MVQSLLRERFHLTVHTADEATSCVRAGDRKKWFEDEAGSATTSWAPPGE